MRWTAFSAVAGYRLVAHDGQAGGQGLQCSLPGGVVDENVRGTHQPGHVIDPAEDDGVRERR